MINLKEGYSHAFFWKSMRVSKFHEPAFRMAVCLRWTTAQPIAFSNHSVLASYRQMLENFFASHPQIPRDSTTKILSQVEILQSACDDSNLSFPGQREKVAKSLASILVLVRLIIPSKVSSEARDLFEAGAMLNTIFCLPVQAA